MHLFEREKYSYFDDFAKISFECTKYFLKNGLRLKGNTLDFNIFLRKNLVQYFSKFLKFPYYCNLRFLTPYSSKYMLYSIVVTTSDEKS